METIATTVTGYGHFEPLKHYAEVHLLMEPNPRGTGNTFSNACHADHLSIGNQRLVEKHLFERDHHGLLTGFPVTDIHFTLLTGRGHNEHTSGVISVKPVSCPAPGAGAGTKCITRTLLPL